MADNFEELQARLQKTQTDYMQTLQQVWDAWLKQYEELNKQLLKAHQDALAQPAASCAEVPPHKTT